MKTLILTIAMVALTGSLAHAKRPSLMGAEISAHYLDCEIPETGEAFAISKVSPVDAKAAYVAFIYAQQGGQWVLTQAMTMRAFTGQKTLEFRSEDQMTVTIENADRVRENAAVYSVEKDGKSYSNVECSINLHAYDALLKLVK